MSGLLISEDDVAEIDASIARRDPAGGPGFFDDFLGAAGRIVPQSLASIPLAWDEAYISSMRAAPDTAGMNPLRVLEQAQEEDVSPTEIIERRRKQKIDNFERSRERYFSYSPDPRTTGMAGQMVQGFGVLATQGVGGGLLAGPAGSAFAMKALNYAPIKIELTEAGVDEQTAAQIADEQSTFYGAMGIAPVAVPGGLATRLLSGAAINTGFGVTMRTRAGDALREAGYGDVAERYNAFDMQAIGIDAALGAFFGGVFGGRGAPRIPPEVLDAALTARDAELRDTRSPLGMPLNNAADRAVAEADLRAQEQIANGDPIDVADIFQNAPMDGPAPVDPPKPGYVRWYHGGAPDGVSGKLWFTSTLADAQGWAGRSDGMQVWYVDVPEAVLRDRFPDTLGDVQSGIAPLSRFEFPEDIANQRQVFPVDRVARPDFAPIDPHAAARDENIAALEDALAELRDLDMGEGTFEADNWLGDVKAAKGFQQATKLRDYIIDRATGLSSIDIAAEYGVTLNDVASQLSNFKRRAMARIQNGATMEQIAQEMNVTLDVLEKAFETRPTRKPEARDVVLRLAKKNLSNDVIAERMRGMGFERTTKESVTVMKSQLRSAGHDIPKLSTSKGNKASRSDAPVMTERDAARAELETALRKSFGKSTKTMMEFGRIQVVDTVRQLNEVFGTDMPDDMLAVHSSRGKIYIIAENTMPSLAREVILHEVGVHHGLERMIGADRMTALNGVIDNLLASGHPAVVDARAMAEAFSLQPEHVPEETIAYLVQNHPDLPLVRRLLAQIRQWLWRAFPDLVDLKVEDIQAMAVAALRRSSTFTEIYKDIKGNRAAFGGGLDTREGRQAWANSSAVRVKRLGGGDRGYFFTEGEQEIALLAQRHPIMEHDANGNPLNVVWSIGWDFVTDGKDRPDFSRVEGGLGSSPIRTFGKIIGLIERLVADRPADALSFTGLSDAHTRVYSRMLAAVMPDGWKLWDVSSVAEKDIHFVLARDSFDPKTEWKQARPIEKVITQADIAAKADRAKDFGVRAYLDWFRESGGDEMRASRGGKKTRDPNTKDMFDPVKAAIADDPDMMIPDNQGKKRPVEEVMMRADEEVKASRELAKGFEAAGACAARHAASMVTQGELRAAELTAGFAAGAAIAGVGANASIPALQDMNDQQAANELQARADADQARIQQERERFKQENPVDAMPIGRSLGNTAFHVSNLTGVPEDFINALVKKESGGDVTAKAETSSATGATQFIDATWAAELTRVGDQLGFRGDPKSEEAKALRNDPRWAMAVGAEYAKANAEDLKRALGRDPTHGEVYLAHFLGPQGAIDLIEAGERDEPNAAKLFPKAAAANQNVFHGSAKTVIARQTKGFSDQPFVVNQ